MGSKGVECSNDTQCVSGTPTLYGNGLMTGRCVSAAGTCEIFGWCPAEKDVTPK